MRRWARDADMWVRRYAILHQLQAKDATDAGLLADVESRGGATVYRFTPEEEAEPDESRVAEARGACATDAEIRALRAKLGL